MTCEIQQFLDQIVAENYSSAKMVVVGDDGKWVKFSFSSEKGKIPRDAILYTGLAHSR